MQKIYIAVHHRDRLGEQLYRLLPDVGLEVPFENFVYSVIFPKVRKLILSSTQPVNASHTSVFFLVVRHLLLNKAWAIND